MPLTIRDTSDWAISAMLATSSFLRLRSSTIRAISFARASLSRISSASGYPRSRRKSPLPTIGRDLFSLLAVIAVLLRRRRAIRRLVRRSARQAVGHAGFEPLFVGCVVRDRHFLSFDQPIDLCSGHVFAAGRLLLAGIENVDYGVEPRQVVNPVSVIIEKDAHLVDAGQLPRQGLALVARKAPVVLDRGCPRVRRLQHLSWQAFVGAFRLRIDEHDLSDIHTRSAAHL